MIDETLDIASLNLTEARAKIDAARGGLIAAGRKDPEAVRAAIAKLDRIEAELKRVETAVANAGVTV
ncbi:hypothetical protein [Paludisphaera soli]|uniref:hypothetical protein n=1 Tax=Paludisphaera soli TaxID=2712865 RepID=UPI0013EAB4C7|nr:hypothetical protein [Paludisphaera soli]